MKNNIHKLAEAKLLEEYPIKAKTTGWCFRADETSNNIYLIEGSDNYGRKISLQDHDYDKLLEKAELEAKKINSEK